VCLLHPQPLGCPRQEPGCSRMLMGVRSTGALIPGLIPGHSHLQGSVSQIRQRLGMRTSPCRLRGGRGCPAMSGHWGTPVWRRGEPQVLPQLLYHPQCLAEIFGDFY